MSLPAPIVPSPALPGADGGVVATMLEGPCAELRDIAGQLDAHFLPAGATVARMVETVRAVMNGLDGVTGAMVDGHDEREGNAAQNLLTAAQRLRDAPVRQAQRRTHVAAMLKIAHQLHDASGDIARILSMLQFYSINLKIAASGAEQFVEFAADMTLKLAAGAKEVDAFKQQIATMLGRLAEMRRIDDLLAQEVARVVPQVPDRLTAEVGRLQSWQRALAGVADGARAVVQRLHGGVAQALAAIQTGDITRQRLEHVEQACSRLDRQLAAPDCADPGGTRGHLLRMLAAQLDDMAGDFGSQAATLVAALDALGPDCRALLDTGQDQGGLEHGSRFLAELDVCVSNARGMTGQLDHADATAAEITCVVLGIAEALRQQMQVFDDLRFDVDYMAINVNIRARRDSEIGKPVAVISDEIRHSSQALAEQAQRIAGLADDLGEVSRAFRAGTAADMGARVEVVLASALDHIRTGAACAEEAINGLAGSARLITRMIANATEDLAIARPIAERLREMAGEFAAMAGAATPEARHDHPLIAMLEAIGLTYTMASERAVHDRFLLPDMAPINVAAAAIVDDDDALF